MDNPRLTWVAPPGWPQAPEGWTPPPGWRPDPAWGPPPDGWVWWQPQQRQHLPSWTATAGTSSRFKKRLGGALAVLVVLLAGAALVPDQERAVGAVAQEEAGGAPASGDDRAATPGPAEPATAAAPVAASAPPAPAVPTEERAPATAAAPPLLLVAAGGDGDSWRDTAGVEYRMGLINTPEANECGGSAATAYRKRALAAGFRAEVYATDRYGRKVAVIVAANGVNLNVAMAKDGIADDRYLAQFRHENPPLASQLDAAFATAKSQRSGIWSSCRSAAPQGIVTAPEPVEPEPAGPAAAGDCHPDYVTCIPIQGDGSGRGQANDLDCGDVSGSVRLRSAGVDPYRLDADGDGVGCD